MTKTDIFLKILVFLKENVGFATSFMLVCVLLLMIVGCDAVVDSLECPGKRVNRSTLDIEVNHFLDKAEIRYQELDRQDSLRRLIFDHAILYTETGTLDPIGIVSSLMGLLGLGVVTDNVRSRVKRRKSSE